MGLVTELVQLLQADGTNLHSPEGQRQLRRARQAVSFITARLDRQEPISTSDIAHLGYLLEPVKNYTWRKTSDGVPGEVNPALMRVAVNKWVEWVGASDPSEEGLDRVFRLFITIKPFAAANEMVAVLLRFWLRSLRARHHETITGQDPGPETRR